MIAPKKPLTQRAAEIDIALSVADAPKPDDPIKSKKPRLRGRARAAAAKVVAPTHEGPKSPRQSKLAPGVKLVREYRGKKIVVLVRGDREFEFNGKVYRSLSKIACEISKSHCSGPRWFGIVAPKKENAS